MTADTISCVWQRSIDQIRSLSECDLHVHLATMGMRLNRQQRQQVNDISNLSLFESDFRLEWMEDSWQDVAAAGEWLLQVKATLSPDAVYLNHYAPASVDWDIPVMIAGDWCAEFMPSSCDSGQNHRHWLEYGRIVKHALRTADLVITQTEKAASDLKNRYQFSTPCEVRANVSRHINCVEEFTPTQTSSSFALSCVMIN